MARRSPRRGGSTDYRAEARRAAERYGLDPDIFERQIGAESGFNPNARSPAGATGIAQIMPGTARGWGVNPNDPIASLDAAARNMAQYVQRYGGYENALRAYNAGPAAIEKSKGYAETNNYVKKILGGRDPGGLSRGGGGTPSVSGGRAASAPASTGPNIFQTLQRLNASTNQDPIAASNYALFSMLLGQREPVATESGAPQVQGGGGGGNVPLGLQGGQVDQIAQELAKKFGLRISSGQRSPTQNRAVGGSPTSLHLSNRARDLSGPPEAMAAAFRYLTRRYGRTVHEAFYDPAGYYLKRGKRVRGAIGGHSDHLHIGV